jgi:HEXXH motif-containing protein
MLLLKSLVVRIERSGGRLGPGARRRFEQDWALLERAERTDAAAVRDVVDYPMTGAWLAEALTEPDGGPGLERHLEYFSGVAVAAAVRARCRITGTLELPDGVLVLPGLGVLRGPPGTVRLSGDAGELRITDTAGRTDAIPVQAGAAAWTGMGSRFGWSALSELPGGAVVLDDLDPYRVPARGIGPEALRADERPHSVARRWGELWSTARALLSATDPARVAETEAVLRAVVPLAPSPHAAGTPMSATLRAAPGAVLTQLPISATDLTEALVHETHHSKLTALHELVPLHGPAGGALHHVAWRPDPRPVPGVLQGAYAHLALTDLWWRARTGADLPAAWRSRAERQFESYRDQVGEALSILRGSDELTFAGREFVDEMGRHHVSLGVAARHSR